MSKLWRPLAFTLSAIMCLLGLGMLFGMATFSTDLNTATFVRFATAALFPFVWMAVIIFWLRHNQRHVAIAAATIVVFAIFIGAVDFANRRPLYSGLSLLW